MPSSDYPKLLICQIGIIFDRASRFHDVNSAGTFAEGQFRSPDGIQGGRQVDVVRLFPRTVVGTVTGSDQVSWALGQPECHSKEATQ